MFWKNEQQIMNGCVGILEFNLSSQTDVHIISKYAHRIVRIIKEIGLNKCRHRCRRTSHQQSNAQLNDEEIYLPVTHTFFKLSNISNKRQTIKSIVMRRGEYRATGENCQKQDSNPICLKTVWKTRGCVRT